MIMKMYTYVNRSQVTSVITVNTGNIYGNVSMNINQPEHMLKNGNDCCNKYVYYVSQLGIIICTTGVSKA